MIETLVTYWVTVTIEISNSIIGFYNRYDNLGIYKIKAKLFDINKIFTLES